MFIKLSSDICLGYNSKYVRLGRGFSSKCYKLELNIFCWVCSINLGWLSLAKRLIFIIYSALLIMIMRSQLAIFRVLTKLFVLDIYYKINFYKLVIKNVQLLRLLVLIQRFLLHETFPITFQCGEYLNEMFCLGVNSIKKQ